jgi:hypothetical protein
MAPAAICNVDLETALQTIALEYGMRLAPFFLFA